MKYEVVNLGCKVNRVESDSYETLLERHGAHIADAHNADLVIVNTCTVTGEAEKKTRKAVRSALRRHQQAHILVTGCAAALVPDMFESLDDRITVVPKMQMDDTLVSHLSSICNTTPQAQLPKRARVGVKVQDGCDNACTYCIVHVARGRAYSNSEEAVVKRCLDLVEQGVSEIVLTGINLGAYKDPQQGSDLSCLLMRLLKDVADSYPCRFRLSSIEPTDVDTSLIELMAASEGRICRHVHIPLQSGSSRVLAQMARPYNASEFVDLVSAMRHAMPSLSVTTDIIAGFPGETVSDFQESLDVARQCGFSKIHVFPYSQRTGTPAAARLDQIASEVKLERASRLRALSDELRLADRQAREGSVELAVVEVLGRACTESYHEVAVSEDLVPGSMVEYRFAVQ